MHKPNLWCRFSPECEYLCSGNYFNSKRDPYRELFTGFCKADLKRKDGLPWKVSEFEILMIKTLKGKK